MKNKCKLCGKILKLSEERCPNFLCVAYMVRPARVNILVEQIFLELIGDIAQCPNNISAIKNLVNKYTTNSIQPSREFEALDNLSKILKINNKGEEK